MIWCLTHKKQVRVRFVAAVCPNDISCQIVEDEMAPFTEADFAAMWGRLASGEFVKAVRP